MSIETAADFEGMRAAGAVVAGALRLLRRTVRPGISTGELDALAAGYLEERGARSAPALDYAFPGTTCISVNEEAVHGIPGERILGAADLVTFDVTVELDGYYADAAVTVPLASAPRTAVRLQQCAEAAFERGLESAHPGAPLWQVGAAIEAEVRRRGFRVLKDLAGHGIGRRIHEEPQVPNYGDRLARGRLTDNLVIAIEPIVSVGAVRSRVLADGWTIASADRSLTAHHEHTVVVRRGAPHVLTAA